VVRQFLEWRHSSCLEFVCPVTSRIGRSRWCYCFQCRVTSALPEAAEATQPSNQGPAALLHRSFLEYACLVWHSGLTAGQCNAIENIQKRAIRMIYSDSDRDYEIVLIVASMNSLKDRLEVLTVRFFKRQVLANNALLHYLLPEPRDSDTTWEIPNPFPQSEPAQISFTNVSCLTVLKTSHKQY